MNDEGTLVEWPCRYRLATGCTAVYDSKAALNGHEKMTAVHAAHRITLRDCPVCGMFCGDEQKRALHLSAGHGITADSPERSEADALHVKELYDAKMGAPAAAVPAGPAAPGNPNGHHPPPPPADLSLLREQIGALIDEVEEQRARLAGLADVEADAARYRQIKAIAGQG